jgi:uncharacterized membrane protein YhdT
MTKKEYFDRDYSFDEIEVDPRFKRCEKEMKITFAVQLLFTFLSVFAAYALGKGPAEQYSYTMGLPTWWFVTILITFVFTGIVIAVTKMTFKDMDLGDDGKVYDSDRTAKA